VRGIDGINCSKMTPAQAREYARRLSARGFTVPCLGSPIGKIRIGEDFQAHLELLKHCAEVARAFGTDLIRVFSFYPPPGGKIADYRSEVMDQMAAMIETASACDVVLLHENEKGIYGAKPPGVTDLLTTLRCDRLKSAFDPANYVEEGVAPYDDGWRKGLREMTDYFHIKDKVPAAATCVPAGQGQGQIREVFLDLKAQDWSGYMTLEPHMSAEGKFSGFTGPDLFAKAAQGLKDLLDAVGIAWK